MPWRRLWAIAHPHRALLLGATASLALVSAGALVVPKLAGDIVDVALDGGTLAGLLRTVGAMILIFVGIGIAAFLEAWMLGIARARIQRDMRRRFFDHLVHLSPSFYDRRRVGELLSRLISDLGAVEGPLTTQIPLGIGALLRFLGTLAVLGWLHPRLTLVALTVVPPIVALSLFVGRRVERVSTGVRDAIAHSTALAQESLTGLRTVQASDAIGPLRRRYRGTVDDVYGVQRRSVFLQAIFAGGATFAGFTAFALVLGYGGALILKLELTPGELMTFLLYTFSIALSVG
ncbi:MAG: ABC transporter transmembrane domain-containing protein, partial [Planctomycetota bacterium]